MKSKIVYRVLFFIFLAVFIGAAGMWGYQTYQNYKAEKEFDDLSNMVIDTEDSESESESGSESETESEDIIDELAGIQVPEKNLDWNALKEKNDHIYAWIYIPNTNVDYPIVQHPTDSSYYLRRDLNGKKSTPGSIYTQHINSTDFTDPHTVIYGHNMSNKTMFATLHKYKNLSFFEQNPYIYIYMEDKVLVYEIFGAYKRDDRHLLVSYNCDVKESFQAYIDSIFEIRDMDARFRDTSDVTADDRIITLSTCEQEVGDDGMRYIVQAVLVNPSALAQDAE